MVRYDEKILNALLDSYEKSVLSRGENKVKIQIAFSFTKKTIPEYFNESSLAYDEIHGVVKELERKEFLTIAWKKGKEGHIIEKIFLNTDHIKSIYRYVKRIPKEENENKQLEILEPWISRSTKAPVLSVLCETKDRRRKNRKRIYGYRESGKNRKNIVCTF